MRSSYILREALFSHNVIELLEAEFSSVGGSSLKHVLKLFVGHLLSEFSGDSSEGSESDGVGARVIDEEVEDSSDAFLSFLVSELVVNGLNESFEFDASLLGGFRGVELSNELEDGGVLGVESKGLHGGLELFGVNSASAVGVEQIEGLSDLIDFVLAQSGSLNSFALADNLVAS